METEDIVKGLADGRKEGNSIEMNTTDCADVLTTIYAQSAEMMGDGDESDNDEGGSTCETEKVGEERGEGGMGSRENHAGCIVEDENVVKTLAGEQFPYDINWVSGRVQPGIVGGVPCSAFKVVGTWVPFPVPKTSAWRNVTLSIVFDRVIRLNDAARAREKGQHALKMWRVLEAKGELRLNDFLYDSFDCGTPWVIGGNNAAARTVCPENDARRDPRWGLVPYEIPITCGRVRMQMRDAMGNVWNMHYINGMLSFRNLNREVLEEEKKAMTCPPHTAGCFFPPLRNPMELGVVDGKLFSGEDGATYTAARGQEATYDGLWSQIWDHVTLRRDVLTATDIGAHVIPEGQLQQHMTPEKYAYRINGSRDVCILQSLMARPFLRIVREVVEETIAPGAGVRFQMTAVCALMEAAEAYLVANFENTNEVAIHSKRVTIQVKDMRLVDRLSKPRWVEKYEERRGQKTNCTIMSMSVAQVEKALAEVMKYAAEGIHYNGDIEFSLLKKRVPRYFAVSVDMRSSITANDEGWMCEDGDVDMTMHQKGGTYAPADFKKLLGTVAKNSDMLVDGSKDELKSGGAEILVLSRMKDITQTPPQDFQDVPVIVADGVEYVLLDQLCDFMKKSDEDRNVIHEALHEREEKTTSYPADRCGGTYCHAFWTGSVLQVAMLRDKEKEKKGGSEEEDEDIEEDEEEDEEASSSDVEVSGSDVSNDEVDEEDDVYYDLKGAGGQMSKGWAHAVLRLARVFPDPHNVLHVVMKGATPDGALHGAENRSPRAPEKRSREDQITKMHRRTKKRISHKKDTTVDMIDLRGSDNVHSRAREEAEEEHDHPSSEKSDREDDNASRDEVDDSETSHGHPRDTDEADDDDGGSDDGTAHEESDDGSAQDDRSASRRASSPSSGGTQRTRVPGRNTTHEGPREEHNARGQRCRHAFHWQTNSEAR
ncbi:hypothetical protein CBR_g13032 [Chara braunii]|uniref:Core Histone H2A/H2B/H3 domain-containing protein n=1 Tax=Chara braunii TaxID=69332 RepID=A0A388KTQ5_CHABU|nr:hypothetical protein CBR_g13032 [Chara braunii]|eukprot:GBG73313.1 hypothetical protein CBR_g13032 [Chara braunii]